MNEIVALLEFAHIRLNKMSLANTEDDKALRAASVKLLNLAAEIDRIRAWDESRKGHCRQLSWQSTEVSSTKD